MANSEAAQISENRCIDFFFGSGCPYLLLWEGRFKSQALLDERTLLSCMAYVDLNPIRANMATTPETSDHTSIKYRIDALRESISVSTGMEDFVGITEHATGIPYRLKDYLALVDWTGRSVRRDKRGAIAEKLPPILERLDLDAASWLILTTEFEKRFQSWVGSEHIDRRVCRLNTSNTQPRSPSPP